MLTNKIDFAVVLSVKNANPNGDPLNGNRPRINYSGYGEMSDVCIKRKIRNRLQDMGEKILVQSDDNRVDNFRSINSRFRAVVSDKKLTADKVVEDSCKEWIDVRAFGQVLAFSGDDMSVGIRGPVSIHTAVSVIPLNAYTMQIIKSVNSVDNKKDINKKTSDTMGQKHRIDFGVYVFYGSINVQLSQKTGFDNKDAEKIKEALVSLFENDASSARPEGSMEVVKVFWWEHNCPTGQLSSAKVHRLLKCTLKDTVEEPKDIDDFDIILEQSEVTCQVLEGR